MISLTRYAGKYLSRDAEFLRVAGRARVLPEPGDGPSGRGLGPLLRSHGCRRAAARGGRLRGRRRGRRGHCRHGHRRNPLRGRPFLPPLRARARARARLLCGARVRAIDHTLLTCRVFIQRDMPSDFSSDFLWRLLFCAFSTKDLRTSRGDR